MQYFAQNLLQRKLSQLPAQRSHPQGNGGQVHLMAFSRFLQFPRMNLNPAAVPAMHIFSAALTRFPVHASLFSPMFMSTFVHVHLCSCPPVFLFDRLCLQAPCPCIKPLGKASIEKKRFLSGIARIMGGGVYPCPNFWPSF